MNRKIFFLSIFSISSLLTTNASEIISQDFPTPAFGNLTSLYREINQIAPVNHDQFLDKIHTLSNHTPVFLSEEVKKEFSQLGGDEYIAISYADVLNLEVEKELQARKEILEKFIQDIESVKINTQSFLQAMYNKRKLPNNVNFFLAYDKSFMQDIQEKIPAKAFNKINSLVINYDVASREKLGIIKSYLGNVDKERQDAIIDYFMSERKAMTNFHQNYLTRLKAFREKTWKALSIQ